MADATFVFDFDSTLVRIETLEALAELALAGAPDAAAVRAEIGRLTDQAMAGEIAFGEALRRRLDLLPLTREHVRTLADRILDEGAPSVRKNLAFFRDHADRLVIISGGLAGHSAAAGMNAIQWAGAVAAVSGSITFALSVRIWTP